MPSCSVVMPAYQNERTLLSCLRSFTALQSRPPCEVVVVDDDDGTSVAALATTLATKVPIRVLRSARKGQSAATNKGIWAAVGDIVLLTCADIIATPQLVAQHLEAHDEGAQLGQRRAVAGHIAYAPWVKMTPFMRFLSGPGPQFDFVNIKDPDALSPTMLYAPNVSARREDLLAVKGFDEGFPYGFQDTDLGLRLGKLGLKFVYRSKARVLHDHPNSLPNFVRRNRMVGKYIPRMLARYPEPVLTARCRASIFELVPLLDKLPVLLEAALEMEAAFQGRRGAQPQLQSRLFALYHQALGLAFVEGLLESHVLARQVLGIDDEAWNQAVSSRPQAMHQTPPILALDAPC